MGDVSKQIQEELVNYNTIIAIDFAFISFVFLDG